MKALSLTQPWASLVALGAKTVETRTWKTPYRGRIAIHAAKEFPFALQELAISTPDWRDALWPYKDRVNFALVNALPTGAVVATAELVEIVRSEDWSLAGIEARQMRYGDFSSGRWIWILADIEALPEPVPAKGALGLWEWTR